MSHAISRRQALVGGATVMVVPGLIVFVPTDADASFLGDLVKGVGTAVTQGFGFVEHTAGQALNFASKAVNSAVNLAGTGIQQLAGVANNVIGQVAPLITAANQALPIFANPTVQSQAFDFSAFHSSQPLQLSDSDYQTAQGDPYGFIGDQGDMLLDYAQQYPLQTLTYRKVVGGQGIGYLPVPRQQVQQPGMYPSVLQFLNLAEEMAPLISLFALA